MRRNDDLRVNCSNECKQVKPYSDAEGPRLRRNRATQRTLWNSAKVISSLLEHPSREDHFALLSTPTGLW